jgi:outer membrane protein
MKRKNRILLIAAALTAAGTVSAQRVLTLEQSLELALKNNCAVRNSRLEAEAAKRIRRAAFTKFFPSISAGGLKFEAQEGLFEIATQGGNLPVYDGNPANLRTATQFAYFPGMTMGMFKSGTFGMVTAVQPVFAGGRIVNGNRLASLGRKVGEYKNRLSENDVVKETEEQYWRVVSLDEKRNTIRKYEELLNRLQGQVEDAYASGIVMKNDVLKVRLKKNEILLNRSKLENGRTLAVMAFCQHVGIPYDSTLCLRDTMSVTDLPQSYFVDDSSAVERRTEYRLLQASVRAEQLQTRMKAGEYLPQAGIGLIGNYMKIDEGKERTVGMAFGTASIPISGWWEAIHTLKERKLREKIAENSFRDNVELLELQIRKARVDFSDSYKQVLLCQESLAQSEENLKVNQDAYDNGVCGVSDLLEAQAMLQQAGDQWTDARAGYLLAKTVYLQATGR